MSIKDRNGDSLYNIAQKTGNIDIINLIEKRTAELAQFVEGEQSLNSSKRKNESNSEMATKKFKVKNFKVKVVSSSEYLTPSQGTRSWMYLMFEIQYLCIGLNGGTICFNGDSNVETKGDKRKFPKLNFRAKRE